MNRKERIFAYISSADYIPLKFSELMTVLDVPDDARDDFTGILNELIKEGRVFVTKRGRYMACPSDVVPGILRCNSAGFAFVTPDDEEKQDIYIPSGMMLDAIHGDRVLVQKDKGKGKNGSPEGHVTKVLERGLTQLTGVLGRFKHKFHRIIPDDKRILNEIKIRPGDLMEARQGDRVLVKIKRIDDKGDIYAEVITNLGNSRELHSNINAIIVTGGIKTEFNEATLKEASKLGNTPEKEDYSGRLDLREKMIFTIDGDDAKDFDDAVSIEKIKNGWRLGVHIADVTHYVRENSALDDEAFYRGTSVYLPGRVIPMLPEKLSNGLCSLKPNEDRLTLSIIMEIDTSGNVMTHTLTESVICSNERLTYNNVNKLLDGDSELLKRYSHIKSELNEMKALAAVLNKRRKDRGAVNFDFPESLIITDEKGYPTDIGIYERGTSNNIIEEFMLIANETVAEYAFWSELPFVYRIHEAPSFEKLNAFKLYARSLGYNLKGKFDKATPVHPKALETLMEQVTGKPEERAIARHLLQSLMKASYSPENLGHFGLSAKYYCHFTSPIRRYPDLAIHRILKDFINGRIDSTKSALYTDFVQRASKRSSDMEIKAQEVERDTEDAMKAYFMADYIGFYFFGVVSGVTNFGMFVELPNTVEGLVRMQNMTDDYYVYNEADMTLAGERHGEIYKIGDKVEVRLIGSDVLSRQIDFELTGKMDETE